MKLGLIDFLHMSGIEWIGKTLAAFLLAFLVGWNLHRVIDRIIIYKSGKYGIEPPDSVLTILGRTMKHPVLHQRITFICISLVLFTAALWFFPVWEAIFLILFSIGAMIGPSIDNRIHLIPNELLLSLFVLSLIYRLVSGGWKDMLFSLLSCLGCGIVFLLAMGVFKLITGKLGMRAGDLKLLMVMGAACGYTVSYGLLPVTAAIFVLSVAVIFFTVYGLVTHSIVLTSYFPFCAFGMIGMMAGLFFPVYAQYVI